MREVVDLLEYVVNWVLTDVGRETDDGYLVGGDRFAGLVLFFALDKVLVESLGIVNQNIPVRRFYHLGKRYCNVSQSHPVWTWPQNTPYIIGRLSSFRSPIYLSFEKYLSRLSSKRTSWYADQLGSNNEYSIFSTIEYSSGRDWILARHPTQVSWP